ncbi:MAG: hypothetical protein GY936_15880 [Ignavibacteriae bacterium]|nr:hypothetical protein [Ignavibacteriota bacterium]
MKNKTKIIIVVSLLTLVISSCGVYNSIMNISKLQYKLGSVNNFKVGNTLISDKSKLSDFNAISIVKLTSQVLSGDFPVSFTVNVLAKNPNKKSTITNSSDITLESFPWTLFIDGTKTISGNISSPILVPSVKNSVIIPLEMKFDLLDFFKGEGLQSIMNLALTLGGQKGSTSKIIIVAEPTIGTPLGNMTYPSPLTIVDKSFK